MDDVPGVISLNLFNFSNNLKVKCLMFFSPEKNQEKYIFRAVSIFFKIKL